MSITLRAKRILTGALAGALVLGLLPAGVASAATTACEGAASNQFADSNPTHQANINCIAAYDVVNGFADGTFGGSRNITRAQMATFIANFAATTLNVDLSDIEIASHTFTDVAGNVHANNIARIFGLGVTAGRTATTYAPNDTITRAEAATMIANAHVALGVDLTGVTPSTAFTDLGTSVHASNINILAGAGVVSGKTATTFGPSQAILRAEIATLLVRSITVLRSQGLWNAPALPGAPVATANIVVSDGVTDHKFEYSDGSEVVEVEIGGTDVFIVDGFTVDRNAFDNDLSIGDEVVVQKDTPATGRQTITLTNRTASFYTSGVTGGLDGDNITIIEPVSGAVLRGSDGVVTGDEEIDITASLSTYTVDGASVTLAQFRDNINRGDTVSISGAGTTANPYVFALTNRTVTGKASANAQGNAPGALTVESGAGFVVDVAAIADGDVVTIDGVTQTGTGLAKKTAIDTHLGTGTPPARSGDVVTYARAGGVQTITITSTAIPAVSGVVGPELTGLDGDNHLRFVTATEETETDLPVNVDDNYTYRVGSQTVSSAVFLSQLTIGDAVTVQERDGKIVTKGTITLTNQALSGKVAAGEIDTVNDVLAVELNSADTPVLSKAINYVAEGTLFGSTAASTYAVNGTTVLVGPFETALNLIAEGTNTGTIVISRVGDATNYALTTAAASAATFNSVTVQDGGETPNLPANEGEAAQVTLTFSQPVRFNSALAAGDFVITRTTTDGTVTTVAFNLEDDTVSPISPGAHAEQLVVTFTPLEVETGDVIKVELTAQGAAKVLDKNGTAAAPRERSAAAIL